MSFGHRWMGCVVGAWVGCAALAQIAPDAAKVDESQLPDWVKRQARSPYKVIIESHAVRAKPAPPKADEASTTALKKAPTKSAPTAAVAVDKMPGSSAVAPPQAPSNSGTAPPGPVADSAIASVPPPAAATEPVAAPEPAPRSASSPPAQPQPEPLTLVRRVEPLLTPDLLDERLDKASVVVAFTVNPNGEVANPSVASSSDPRLAKSVLRAVKAWRYAPIPMPVEHSVSFSFKTE